MAICTARRTNGQKCSSHAIRGGTVCSTHGGSAPQVKRAALERILAAADPVAAEMIRLSRKAKSEAVRRQACTDLLDRAGVARTMELTGKAGAPLIAFEALDALLHGDDD